MKVYGLQATVKRISGVSVAFQPCSGRFSSRQCYQGGVKSAHRASMSNATLFKSFLDASAGSASGETGGSDAVLSTTGPDVSTVIDRSNLELTTPLNAPQLEVVPTYIGLPLTNNEVFTTALSVMFLGAEKGPGASLSGQSSE